MKRTALLSLSLSFGTAMIAGAQTTFYDNTVNFGSQAYRITGATTASRQTYFDADDIQVGAGFGGGLVNAFTFSTYNSGTAAVTANVRVRFYNADATTGAPTTLISGFDFSALSIPTGVGLRSATIAAGSEFAIPADGFFWAGIEYDSTTATAAQLNQLGQGFFNAPTVGSSDDLFFSTDATGVPGNNPVGAYYNFDPGDGTAFPPSNFGWKFSGTTSAVPEPATMAVLGLGAAALLRRRRKSA